MMNLYHAEWIKEKRSANARLAWLVPLIFILFTVLMVCLMGKSPTGKSYGLAAAFNWYPALILPIVISLLTANSRYKEKPQHLALQKSLGVDPVQLLFSKTLIILVEFAFILFASSVLLYIINSLLIGDTLVLSNLFQATLVLYVGGLPILALTILMITIGCNRILPALINIILSFIGAIQAPLNTWWLFPWSYSLRMLAPVIGVHPNGTFLEPKSPLWNIAALPIGCICSLLVFSFAIIGALIIERKRHHD